MVLIMNELHEYINLKLIPFYDYPLEPMSQL